VRQCPCQGLCVCVYYCSTYYKAVREGGKPVLNDAGMIIPVVPNRGQEVSGNGAPNGSCRTGGVRAGGDVLCAVNARACASHGDGRAGRSGSPSVPSRPPARTLRAGLVWQFAPPSLVGHRHSLPHRWRPVSALCSAGDAVPALAQMKHWELSGQKARKMMNNYFHRVEVRSEASHLQDYVDDHPFLGDHPRASVSAAIKRSLSLSSEQRRMCTHSRYVQVECGNTDRLSGLGTGALESSVWWATRTRATRAMSPRGQAGRWHERFLSRSCTGRRTTKRCELSRAQLFAQLTGADI